VANPLSGVPACWLASKYRVREIKVTYDDGDQRCPCRTSFARFSNIIGKILVAALRTETIASRAPQPMADASSTATYTFRGDTQIIDLNAIAAGLD